MAVSQKPLQDTDQPPERVATADQHPTRAQDKVVDPATAERFSFFEPDWFRVAA